MMKPIKSLKELKTSLLRLREVEEDPRYSAEQERQQDLRSSLSSMDEAEVQKDDTKSSKTLSADKSSLKSGTIKVDQIIDKLNTIRSGKSFKDENIKASLDQYISSLKTPEKVALFAFLKGISQIVTGEISGEKALEPSDPGPSVKMEKNKYKKIVKPVIIKKSGDKKIEDTTAPKSVPAPIVPKK